jgi:phage shock protein PspC (stress-responsive transcriptional regulator)
MIQNASPVKTIPADEETVEMAAVANAAPASDRAATIWVHRITGVVGGICLALGLAVWFVRPGHYRLVLAFLVVAMFAAILHSYTFENGNH